MKLEEAIKILSSYEKKIVYEITDKDKKAVKTILKYIKEESIPIAILEEKLKIEKETRENIQKHYDEDRMKAVNERILIIEEILNKGE